MEFHFPYDLCQVSSEEAEIINRKIDAFNAKQLTLHSEIEELKNFLIKDNGCVIAGIRICLYFNECMVINALFVDEQYRGQGLGSWLLQYVEEQAKSLGIRLIHLDAFDFQAKDFYLKHGYEIFGVLEDCPKGHNRYYLKKLFLLDN